MVRSCLFSRTDMWGERAHGLWVSHVVSGVDEGDANFSDLWCPSGPSLIGPSFFQYPSFGVRMCFAAAFFLCMNRRLAALFLDLWWLLVLIFWDGGSYLVASSPLFLWRELLLKAFTTESGELLLWISHAGMLFKGSLGTWKYEKFPQEGAFRRTLCSAKDTVKSLILRMCILSIAKMDKAYGRSAFKQVWEKNHLTLLEKNFLSLVLKWSLGCVTWISFGASFKVLSPLQRGWFLWPSMASGVATSVFFLHKKLLIWMLFLILLPSGPYVWHPRPLT